MKRQLPPHVYASTSRGRTYYRFRRGSVAQQVDPSSPDFWTVYAALMERRGPILPGPRSFAALIKDYRADQKFKALAPRTKADYGKVLDHILARMADKHPANVRKVHVVQWQRELSGRFASYFVQVLSVLMGHACDIGWRDDNPCAQVRLAKPESRSPHEVWTDEAVATFRAGAKGLPRLIFEMGIGLGQRPDDLTRINWEDFTGTHINLTQSKTGRALRVPCGAHLIAALEASRPRVMRIGGATPILARGLRRLGYRQMAYVMLKERQRLGVEDYDLHAMRYRACMELAYAGCTDEEIGAITGHVSKAMIAKYAGIARQQVLADAAHGKREARAKSDHERNGGRT